MGHGPLCFTGVAGWIHDGALVFLGAYVAICLLDWKRSW